MWNPLRGRARKIAVGVGSSLAVAAVAFATVSLSTEIGGSTAMADSSASLNVTSVTTSAATGGLVCTGSPAGSAVRIDLRAKRFNGNVPEQSCTVAVTVKNPGTQPITLTDLQTSPASALQGWSFVPQSGDPVIQAGGERTYTAQVKTGGANVSQVGTGSFTAKLVGSAQG